VLFFALQNCYAASSLTEFYQTRAKEKYVRIRMKIVPEDPMHTLEQMDGIADSLSIVYANALRADYQEFVNCDISVRLMNRAWDIYNSEGEGS